MTIPSSASRQRILDVATDLFYHEGIRAVGIDTIVERSGVAKMTLYRYFPSKDDLIVAYLEERNRAFWRWFDQAISQHDAPGAQLLALFRALAALVAQPACLGCPFLNVASEFPERDHPAHQVALAHKQAVCDRLANLARRAGARHPTRLAEQLLLLMDGAYMSTRLFGPGRLASAVQAAAETLIAAALPSSEQEATL
jgi:AcrR family transcriptional regulator